jgi:Domain of unknown function (DUF4157)
MEYFAKSRTTETHRIPQLLHEVSSASQSRIPSPNNQAMQELLRGGCIQAKLTLGDIDDPAEQEAERIAADVTASDAADKSAVRENDPHTIHRAPSSGHTSMDAPGIVEQLLQSGGRPLDPESRSFFEPRFGQDFTHVRIHTGSEAAESARSIQAHAYTAGSDIVFDQGQFSPHSTQGRSLLAHELTHVLQHRSAPSTTIRRQPNSAPAQPARQDAFAVGGDDIRKQVDDAVREFYQLSGPGLTSANVQFLEESKFGSTLSKRDLESSLRYIFSYYGNYDQHSIPGQILDVYELQILEIRPFYGYTPGAIDDVVQRGLKDGYFEYHSRPTIDEKGTQQITTRDLVTSYLHGVTDITGPRTKRKIKIETSGGVFNVATLVHEACHFYVSDAFKKFALAQEADDKYLGGALISSILFEGFAEFFAARVMRAHEDEFGSPSDAYPLQKGQAERLAATLGEDAVEAAYFGGDATQLKRLAAALQQYRLISPDLLLPGFIIDSALSGTSPRK